MCQTGKNATSYFWMSTSPRRRRAGKFSELRGGGALEQDADDAGQPSGSPGHRAGLHEHISNSELKPGFRHGPVETN
jgi:hypothetical protein